MGVPRFYRWLSERYPLVNEKLLASVNAAGNTNSDNLQSLYSKSPALYQYLNNLQLSSTSSFKVDCLYLDLNGVLHGSTHANSPNGRLMVEHRFEEVWLNIMAYIGRIVEIAKPRRLLYVAVDGVAPRAKMNQQRSRRFRSAAERNSVQKLYAEPDSSAVPDGLDFDSNCITPGTEFMFQLQRHLDFFISRQMSENALWKNLEVILSGPDVPGEGEHKIAEFIRALKSRPEYPPNLAHCIHGLDADLVMLSLMTHEPLFTLLREEVVLDQEPRWITDQRKLISRTDSFQLLHISLLREYLALDVLSSLATKTALKKKTLSSKKHNPYEEFERESVTVSADASSMPFKTLQNTFKSKAFRKALGSINFDVERIFDDFLLFCCLSGNDFLPHLAFADIGKNGLNKLLDIYIDHLVSFSREDSPSADPWLLEEGGRICWWNFLSYLEKCLELESDILEEKVESAKWLESKGRLVQAPNETDDALDSESIERDAEGGGPSLDQWYARGRCINSVEDQIAFYYWRKMGFDITDGTCESARLRDTLVNSYLEGLQWTMLYYFDGVPSWSWFYPFHYAPYVRDLICFLKPRVGTYKPSFTLGKPFKPFQQLMAVLPPLSASLIPNIYRPLMNENSAIHDFYPEDFAVDREGVKVTWGGVTLLPFIDEDRLIAEMDQIDNESNNLSDDEKLRNSEGNIYVYRRDKLKVSSPLVMLSLLKAGKIFPPEKRASVASTLPSHLASVFGNHVPLRHVIKSAEFRFKDIQMGTHRSAVPAHFEQPPYQPTFLNWHNIHSQELDLNNSPVADAFRIARDIGPSLELADENEDSALNKTTDERKGAESKFEQALWQTRRIVAITRQKDLVRAFYRITKNPSLIISLAPSSLSPLPAPQDQMLSIALSHFSAVFERIHKRIGHQLDFDYSLLPTVRCSYPYKHVGKLIGIWMDDIGYSPLHQRSRYVETSFQEMLIADIKFVPKGWKSGKQSLGSICNSLYNLLVRKGIKFAREENIILDGTSSRLLKSFKQQLLQIKSLFSVEKCKLIPEKLTFNWKEIIFEILDIEEIAENLASKPLIRYKQNQSHLCFYPEIDFVYDTMTTENFHQALDSNSTQVGDTVMCSAETPFFGNIGFVAESNNNSLLCQFDVTETPESRYDYQKRILDIYLDAYDMEKWYSLNDLCKAVKKSAKVLRCVLRKLSIKMPSTREFVDIGLGLMQDAKNLADGSSEPVCIPGYSYIDDNNQYNFSQETVPILSKFFSFWPHLESSIIKSAENEKITFADLFGDSDMIEVDRQAHLMKYLQWMNCQPFKTVGTAFRNYDCVPVASLEKMLNAVLKQEAWVASVVPAVNWIRGYQNVLKELYSPVVPIKKIKSLTLGQRVVIVKSGSLAVYGTRGVIVGLYPGSPEDKESELVAEIISEKAVIGGSSVNMCFASKCRRLRIPCRFVLPIPPIAHFGNLPPKFVFLEHAAAVLKQSAQSPTRKVLEHTWRQT
eukprot:Gregarina_sp_Poly_1__667@NODE_115_length_13858_cov_166_056486_g102_i0_p1_GENE_NODE_115_length_13858_cov_166_056486_g102_i0NODE_115_length_13858_cov_166_056486_g102_i0_p1_ORF_typecomplete_len1479_score250_58XRN_N/PF03159_18/7_1e79XRN_M/PF17846_1/8_8e76SH3_12/PF18129_1/7_1e03SH3_12/PF18129_1/1_3e07LPD22/PF18834_1/5_3e02LPD22/PF18834_1/1_3_NODE_115_length_13858_cov_166_056486_g102_i055619997